jgi:hypothetical protein
MDSLKHSFVLIVRQIIREYSLASRLSGVDIKNLDEVIEAVKGWLSLLSNTRWLMIFDNYNNPRVANNTNLAAVNIC